MPRKQLLLCLAFFAVHSAFATIRYVNASVSGGANNGTSWANAYNDLQPAIAAAQAGDQIWVAKGTYYPTTSTTDRTASFVMKNNVGIYGGFTGTETSLSQRDWTTNVTTLSGDIDHVTDPLVVTGSGSTLSITGNVGNSSHVVLNNNNGLDNTAIIDGFNIVGGYTNSEANPYGSGMYNNSSSPNLQNMVFLGNYASYGGAIFNMSCNPILTRLSILKNIASYGGGLYNSASAPILYNVVFSGNIGGFGGGMLNAGHSYPKLYGCVFSGNYSGSGGGIYNDASSPTVANTLLLGNIANQSGGGVYSTDLSLPWLADCILYANTAVYGGAIYTGGTPSSHVVLDNCIIWGNSSVSYNDSQNIPLVTYSDIQGGYTGTGNINQDPLFVNAANPAGADGIFGTADDGLKLQPTSPCINTGSNAAIPAGITTDIAGLPRIMGGTVDMGAYESANGVATAFTGCPNVNLAIATGYNTYNGEPMTIYNVDTTTGAATAIAGGPLKDPYTGKNMDSNGFGLNPQDGFLYGIRDTISISDTTANATFYRVGSNYGAVPLGLILPPPTSPGEKNLVNPSAGAFDNQGNFYFFGAYVAYHPNTTLSRIDHLFLGKISNAASLPASSGTITPTYIDLNNYCPNGFSIYGIGSDTGSAAISTLQDVTYSNITKQLYAYQVYSPCYGCSNYMGQLIAIDPATGNANCIGDAVSFGAANNQTSGILTTANGSLMVALTSGDIYKSVLNPDGTYSGSITKMGTSGIAGISGQPGSIRGDLASCGFGTAARPSSVITSPSILVSGYPNPVQSIVTLSFNHTLNNATLRLVSLSGSVINQVNGVSGNTYRLDLSKGASGVYMIEVMETGAISRLKIIKE